MIFVTVGTQLPFDRLVRQVDLWAAKRGRKDVFAQIGPTQWKPEHIEWVNELSPERFQELFEKADAIVAHAGMGTIISALEYAKPLVIMPRLARYREQRNDHQIATARRFGGINGVRVADDESMLMDALDRLDELKPTRQVPSQAHAQLLDALRRFVNGSQTLVTPAGGRLAMSPDNHAQASTPLEVGKV